MVTLSNDAAYFLLLLTHYHAWLVNVWNIEIVLKSF
jgi:hypothetical protein